MSKQPYQPGEKLKIGEKILVTIKRMGINGEGVGYFHRKAVFIPGAIVDEVVRARVNRVESTFIEATIVQLVKESPHRIEPACPVYAQCGGCQLQHMDYSAQRSGKEAIVREAFARYTKLTELPLRPIFGMKDPWDYRNKAQMQLNYLNGDVQAGLYAEGSHQLVAIKDCGVQHPAVNRVIEAVRDIIARFKLPIYVERKRNGGLRTIVARVAPDSGKVQLTIVTADNALHRSAELVGAIQRACPEVISIAQNVNPHRSSMVFGEKTVLLWGEERLPAQLGSIQFQLSPRAFFQLNSSQTVRMYDAVREAAQLTGKEKVVDAYCGTGTIALWLADQAAEVRGIEVVEDAIEDARRNAKLSGRTNVEFHVGRSEQLLPHWVKGGYRPDVIVVDPPRTGCEADLLHAFVKAQPARIVYVSCNPSTLAKDCKLLVENGYHIKWVQPIDMFPQTAQVEAVALLERR